LKPFRAQICTVLTLGWLLKSYFYYGWRVKNKIIRFLPFKKMGFAELRQQRLTSQNHHPNPWQLVFLNIFSLLFTFNFIFHLLTRGRTKLPLVVRPMQRSKLNAIASYYSFFFTNYTVQTQTLTNTHAPCEHTHVTLPLWAPPKDWVRQILDIDEVTTDASLSTGTSPTTKKIATVKS
jgi:hypothetical protein